MAGNVITFYSYKGGVGRSFALVNIAAILAEWGARVLVVDWDIEAPGLNHYFAPYTKEMKGGVLDFLSDCQKGVPQPLSAYTSVVQLPDIAGHLKIMPAASTDGTDYTAQVQALDWEKLYSDHYLGKHLEDLRKKWLQSFDVVLIDSRTGVTDFSGLTTAQLPDILVFMFTANEQSLNGCADIAMRAMEARRNLPLDRPALLPLPIPSRFEQREEYDRAKEWRLRFVKVLAPFMGNWMPKNVDPAKLIDLLTIPYVPRWTFGEDIASVDEKAGSTGTRTASQAVSYACETIASLIIQKFDNVDLLVSSREEYVHAGRSVAKHLQEKTGKIIKVYISYLKENERECKRLVKVLKKMGGRDIKIIETGGSAGLKVEKEFLSVIESADAYIIVIGAEFYNSSWQQQEIEQLLRMNLRSTKPKSIIPVVLVKGEDAFIRSRLADYQAVFLDKSDWSEDRAYPILRRLLSKSDINEISPKVLIRQKMMNQPNVLSAADIFIAYSLSDQLIAERLGIFFEKQGWSVFIDRNSFVGYRWHREIEKQLMGAKAVVVLWSSSSRDSDYVLDEAEYGKRKDILFPAFIEAVEYPYGFGRIQTADLIGWDNGDDHAGLKQLLNSIRQHLNGDASTSTISVETIETETIITPALPAPGQTFRDKLNTDGEGPLMVTIPAGRFLMGSPQDEQDRYSDEDPQYEVHIAQPFALGVYPVTFDEYDLFCKQFGRERPEDANWGRGNRPVINVSWHDARDYCKWLSDQTGNHYRLPSEAEWEYACRAGTQTPYFFGSTLAEDKANFKKSVGKTTPVGDYPANAFGLYDMHGNVWEWCEDAWHKDYHGAPADGSAWLDGSSRRVLRGGSWISGGGRCRSASRYYDDPSIRNNTIGFRLARGQ